MVLISSLFFSLLHLLNQIAYGNKTTALLRIMCSTGQNYTVSHFLWIKIPFLLLVTLIVTLCNIWENKLQYK